MNNIKKLIVEAAIENKGKAVFLKNTMYLVVHKGTDWVVDEIFSDKARAEKSIEHRSSTHKVVEAKINMPS